jgi:predicted butyrate kinase (DUF1464 family)
MACASCGRQRALVANKVKSGDLTGAAKETARGAAMMAGNVAGAVKRPFSDIQKLAAKVTGNNKDRGHGR